jgi:glucose/arabinose dehydrogenase
LQTVASGLTNPIAITFRHNDARMYVAQQNGVVKIVNTNHTLGATVVTVPSKQDNGEQGLLGMVFSADGTKLYVDYNDNLHPNGDVHIVEYTMSGDTAVSPHELLLIPHQQYSNHNGGDLEIGPDGKLYISIGDGGGGGDPLHNAQNVNSLLGKILRINNDGTIPSDNPFHGRSGHEQRVWMYGLRNPFRFSFDKSNHEMWIGDVGQDLWEEVDWAAAGQKGTNWGWNQREGKHPYKGGARPAGALDPIYEVSHNDSSCAIIGGYVYRGRAIANLNGAYLFSDNCRGQLVGVVRNGNNVSDARDMGVSINGPSTFGEDANGELYVASLSDGKVYKLVQGTTQPVGYWHAGANGKVFGFHNVPTCAPGGGITIGVAGTPFGYWTTTTTGAVAACRLPNYGSMAGKHLNKPIVGIAQTASGRGYWLVASDGGIFSFGDAKYYGSTGSLRLRKPIVGMATTPTGKGYRLVAGDGGMFNFGDAKYFGSTGGVRPAPSVVAMASTPTGNGYWIASSTGGIFTFGDAKYYGSAPGSGISTRLGGMTATPTGKGYWMVGNDGRTMAFGDARNWGSSAAAANRTIITGIAHN